MNSGRRAVILGVYLACSAVVGVAVPPQSSSAEAGQGRRSGQVSATAASRQLSTVAKLGLQSYLANCMRSDATVLVTADGRQILNLAFLTKQPIGYCGCKSAVAKIVVSYGEPTKHGKEFYRKFNSLEAVEKEVEMQVPLSTSPGDFYGVEVKCAG